MTKFMRAWNGVSDDAAVYISAFCGVLSIRAIPILIKALNGSANVDLSPFNAWYFAAVAVAAAIAMGASYAQNKYGMKEADPGKLKANKAAKASRVKARCWSAFLQGAGILGLLSSFGGGN